MAANYWASSQRLHWQMSREKLAETRAELDARDKKTVQAYPLPNYRQLSIFFNIHLLRLGRRMTSRQQALATAQLYVRRFYTKVPIRDTNPFLVMATCLYLALKMEECPQHIRLVVDAARALWPAVVPTNIEKLAECEFYVISELNSYLIVHHPYRPLHELTPTLGLTEEENNTARQVINDSCITDLPLIYPPHIIALTAIFLAVFLKPALSGAGIHGAVASVAAAAASTSGGLGGGSGGSGLGGSGGGGGGGGGSAGPGSGQGAQNRIGRLIEWYAESKIDMEAIVDCTQEIISLYEVWDSFGAVDDQTCRDQLFRMIKQRSI